MRSIVVGGIIAGVEARTSGDDGSLLVDLLARDCVLNRRDLAIPALMVTAKGHGANERWRMRSQQMLPALRRGEKAVVAVVTTNFDLDVRECSTSRGVAGLLERDVCEQSALIRGD